MLPALLIFAAATPVQELPEIKFRALSFNEPVIELAIVDAQKPDAKPTTTKSNGKDKKDSPSFEPLKVYNVSLTEEKKIHYADGKLTFYKANTDPDGVTTLTPFVEAVIPSPDTPYIAIISGSSDKPTLQLVTDSPEKMAAGSMRFFNVCKARLGLNFPGLRKVLSPGEDILYQPAIKDGDYAQGQFLLCDENSEWKPASSLRWMQSNDTRSLWFIIPHLSKNNLVLVKEISERVPTAEEIKQAKEKEDEAKKTKADKSSKKSAQAQVK